MASPLDITIDETGFIVIYDRRIDSGIMVRAVWAPSVTSSVWRLKGDGMTEVAIGTAGDVGTMAVVVPLDSDYTFIRLEVGD